jgi:hypothetical protein
MGMHESHQLPIISLTQLLLRNTPAVLFSEPTHGSRQVTVAELEPSLQVGLTAVYAGTR